MKQIESIVNHRSRCCYSFCNYLSVCLLAIIYHEVHSLSDHHVCRRQPGGRQGV